MWAAIRYRRAQAAVLAILAALVTTCAVVAPLYERGLEQSLLSVALQRAAPADLALTVSAGRTAAFAQTVPATLEANVPGPATALYGTPVGMITNPVSVIPRKGLVPSPTDLLSRTDVCKHLRITTGRCPSAPNQVLVSAKDMAAWGWKVGQPLGPGREVPKDTTGAAPLVVAGAYEVVPDGVYWGRTQIDGKSGTLIIRGLDQIPALDSLVTPESTFTKEWGDAQLTLTLPLRRNVVTLDSLDDVVSALNAPNRRAAGQGVNNAVLSSQLPELIDSVSVGHQRVRVIVPLLMAQLGLLAAAILLLVAQAAVEQRRPEVALARLRGRSRDGAGRLVMGELAVTVAIGVPIGLGAALVLNEIIRRAILPGQVPFEVPLLAVGAALLAAVVCLVAIWLAVRPVRRLAVAALLRRVAPQRGKSLGIVDLLAVALAIFGVVGLATHSLQGPLALITPTLVALAAGLVASRVAIPIAGASGRASLKRGRIAPALTAFGLERRPAMRKVVTVVSVAVALTVFAANALVVANRNWTQHAQSETGAAVVLDTDSRTPVPFLAAVRQIDPRGERLSPVALVRRTDQSATATLAVVAGDFPHVAFPASQPLRLSSLAPPSTKPVALEGSRVTGTVAWDMQSTDPDSFVRPPGQSGAPTTPGEVAPDDTDSELRVLVTTPSGQRLSRVLMAVPSKGKGSAQLDAPLLCPAGCRLDGLQFGKSDFVQTVSGTLRITGLGIDGRSLRLAGPEQWNQTPPPDRAPEDSLKQTAGTADTLALQLASQGEPLVLSHADVPTIIPGILAGPVPPGGAATSFSAVGLSGAPIAASVSQQVPDLPVLGGRGLIVDYETLARLGGPLSDNGRLSVWLKSDSPAEAARVTQALANQGITVTNRHTYAAAKERLDQSASAWGLRLAAFAGVMSVLLACLVVIVMSVTGWRVVVRDLAALHLSGVPMGVLRRSLVREQVIVVLCGAAVGAICGAVSSVIAMPLVPLFDTTGTPVPAVDLAPSLLTVVGSALVAALVVSLVGIGAAVATGRRIQLRRVREAL